METERERYKRIEAHIDALEEERRDYWRRGIREIPSHIEYGLLALHADLEEARIHANREHVREIEEGQREAAERDMRDRVAAELERIANAPKIEPQELRRARLAAGASQYELAMFAGVSTKTISRIEASGRVTPEEREESGRFADPMHNRAEDPRPARTLQLISAGLEQLKQSRAESEAWTNAHTRV